MNFARIFHSIDILKMMILTKCYTFIITIKYSFYPNCKLGKDILYVGFPKFRNKPGGKIFVGNSCAFLSNHKSNYIGINRPCIISTQDSKAMIIIGNYCRFSGTVIGAFTKIVIRDHVRCGANTLITDSDWHLDDPRAGKPSPVLIEENVWLGEGVKILKGVTIGKNSVIGAGSVVTKSIPENVIAAGNPCRIIKSLL